MALITRLSRLFTADMHAVIDRMEEPDILLKQAIRDMDAAVAGTQRRVHALAAQAEQLDGARTDAERDLTELRDELDVCLNADNDELARSVIRRQLALAQHLTGVTFRDAAVGKELDELQRNLARQRNELCELRQKADLFDVTEGEKNRPQPAAAGIPAEAVEVALLKEKQRRATA